MHRIALSVALLLSIFLASPASAQVVITQAKALAGNVTPGDTAGYPISLLQPGAYVLGSNLTVPSGTYGIYAGVDNIDIDLNGFTISGGAAATYGFVSSKARGHIHDGTIQAFKSSGIYLRGDAWTIEDMKIVQNGGYGIDATDSRLITLQSSLISVNGGRGIMTGDIGLFRNNQIVNNIGTGIVCVVICHAEGNIIDLNQGIGITFGSGTVIGNTITRNAGYGINDSFGIDDIGYASNTLIGNNTNSDYFEQVSGAINMNPNKCIGKPCTTP